jgi:hypothetical protein
VELLPRLAAWSAQSPSGQGAADPLLFFIFAPRDPSCVTKGVSFFGNQKISAQRETRSVQGLEAWWNRLLFFALIIGARLRTCR